MCLVDLTALEKGSLCLELLESVGCFVVLLLLLLKLKGERPLAHSSCAFDG